MLVSKKRVDQGVILLLFLWLCGGLLYVLPNHGGEGLSLPQNILAWTSMALIALWCLLSFPSSNRHVRRLPAGSLFFISGAVLWSLPLCWTPHREWQINAIPKVLALWGMVSLYILLLYTTSGRYLRRYGTLVIVIAALLQAVYAIVQLFNLPDVPGGRPFASFQQINVLASFLATGYACSLWLFFHHGKRLWRYGCGFAVVAFPSLLVVLQSRAGYIGAIVSSFILLSLFFPHKRKQTLIALALIVLGTLIGFFWLYNGHLIFPWLTIFPVDKENSTLSRLYMLKLTWQLILGHPFLGNGYGGFEFLFGELAKLTPPGLESATLKYPHNELLYAWSEGGLIAVAGILCLVAGVFRQLWGPGGTKLAGLALLMPLAIHINLEYPLYQSITHGLVFILLLHTHGSGVVICEKERRHKWHGVLVIPVLAVVVFMLLALQTQARLTAIEEQGLMPFVEDETGVSSSLLNPYSQYQRLDFDRHVALLLRFNLTHDPSLLNSFRYWANRYLSVHNDPSVYFSLIMIARAQQRPELLSLCQKAKNLWSSDPRFDCPEIEDKKER